MSDTPKITLHWLEISRSHRLLWLLEELKIPYELKTWKRGDDKKADPKLKEVHPLGKSPVLTVETTGSQKPLVLIESSNIAEYLCDYYGKQFVPTRYLPGKEGQIGEETEQWLRYRTFMHYAEGSIMPLSLISLIMQNIRDAPVPFFIKPILKAVSSNVYSQFLNPNFKTHYGWLESQLATSPDGGPFLCGKDFTAADVLMSFPLEAGRMKKMMPKEDYPKLWAYLDVLQERPAWKSSLEKIAAVENEQNTKFKWDL